MSATRLLVLGVVRGFGTAHGYLVRAELVSWGAEEWANIKWGSLYHALRQLAREGLLSSTEHPDWPGRVDYELTEHGAAEFHHLLRDALRRFDHRPDMLMAGLALLPALARDEAIELLRERLDQIESSRAAVVEQTADWTGPAHVRELFDLSVYTARTGAEWTSRLIKRLERGDYLMAGEDPAGFGAPASWPLPGKS